MKSILILFIIFGSFRSENSNIVVSERLLPEYNVSFYRPLGSCQCSGVFVSCSQTCDGSNCTCTCSAFACSCTACKDLKGRPQASIINILDDSEMSMSKEQYSNFETLADLIDNEQTDLSKKSVTKLNEMIKAFGDNDHQLYKKLSGEFVLGLSELSQNKRYELNNFFKLIGSDLTV